MIFVWTLGDVIGLVVLLLCGIVGLWLWLPMAFKQWRCKHDGDVRENRECDAFCAKCGKNLGFIGAWRKRAGR